MGGAEAETLGAESEGRGFEPPLGHIVIRGMLGLCILGATSRGKRFIDKCHVPS